MFLSLRTYRDGVRLNVRIVLGCMGRQASKQSEEEKAMELMDKHAWKV